MSAIFKTTIALAGLALASAECSADDSKEYTDCVAKVKIDTTDEKAMCTCKCQNKRHKLVSSYVRSPGPPPHFFPSHIPPRLVNHPTCQPAPPACPSSHVPARPSATMKP